jgi:hypothetical protein
MFSEKHEASIHGSYITGRGEAEVLTTATAKTWLVRLEATLSSEPCEEAKRDAYATATAQATKARIEGAVGHARNVDEYGSSAPEFFEFA